MVFKVNEALKIQILVECDDMHISLKTMIRMRILFKTKKWYDTHEFFTKNDNTHAYFHKNDMIRNTHGYFPKNNNSHAYLILKNNMHSFFF